MDDKSKPDPALKPITHLLVAGVGWIPVERGEVRQLKSGDHVRYQWEADGATLTIEATAILGSKRGGRAR
jgi:hypothetical protein